MTTTSFRYKKRALSRSVAVIMLQGLVITSHFSLCLVEAILPRVQMSDIHNLIHAQHSFEEDTLPVTVQWTSLNPTMEFLPASTAADIRRRLQNNGKTAFDMYYEDFKETQEDEDSQTINPYRIQPFTSGVNDYDEYQQAWRMLGFMIDCDVRDGDEWYDGAQPSHSRDDNGSATSDGCARFILWAAYVDLDYQGGGIGEYQYWDRNSETWDDSACQYGNSDRCAKMDCHLDDTSFRLLGFFKHRSYDDWMEQLFKHEGMCVWTEEEYAFMKGARKAWPQGCTPLYTMNENRASTTMYYDIKPMSNGRITIAIYRDSKCTDEFSDDLRVVESLLGNPFTSVEASRSQDYSSNYDFSSDSLEDSLHRWESAFSEWTYCHPCVAFDIENVDGTKYLANNDDGGNNAHDDDGRRLGGNYEAQGEIFECYDDAGYTNVNQCMKFSAKTYMQTGTFRDMTLARLQNVMADSPLSGFYHHAEYKGLGWTNAVTYVIFLASFGCCLYACVYAFRAQKEGNYVFEGKLVKSMPAMGKRRHQTMERKGSGSSSGSKEKPLIEIDQHDLT
ncbi:hypothetical protein IV203_002044 [Nitzschia inconspicua]|uniref:Uncharacterized protein n=1 Tax=Nitzschia inconspicua TaxID=303405 RepID=A0A9K3PS35_9STRA|nr:hypothetical protein IV203_002044 [Nitzschia inconspicua]